MSSVSRTPLFTHLNDHSQSRGISTYYDGTGSARWAELYKIHDVIIDVPSTYGIIDQASNDADVLTDIQRTTIKTADRGITFVYDCPTTYTLTDCVFLKLFSGCSKVIRHLYGHLF